MQVPYTQAGVWPTIRPGRFAELIRRGNGADRCRLAIVGLPDDLGVRLNHGRPGAALGPTAFRAALAAYGTAWDAGTNRMMNVGVADVGDVIPAAEGGNAEATLRETHDRVTEALLAVHGAGLIPVCIGGGHDLTFPTVRALSRHMEQKVGGMNVDAHLDVRETMGSGMPFRALIDGGFVEPREFSTIGVGRFANAPEHVKWLISRGGHVSTSMAVTTHQPKEPGARFVSFDMDVLDGALAPGVSAVNPCGMSVAEGVRIVDGAGRDPSVHHFDIMELNPVHDDPAHPGGVGRTARIAALLFLTFVAAFAERGS